MDRGMDSVTFSSRRSQDVSFAHPCTFEQVIAPTWHIITPLGQLLQLADYVRNSTMLSLSEAI